MRMEMVERSKSLNLHGVLWNDVATFVIVGAGIEQDPRCQADLLLMQPSLREAMLTIVEQTGTWQYEQFKQMHDSLLQGGKATHLNLET